VVLRWWRWVVGHWASRRSQADLVTRLRGGLRRSLSRLTVSHLCDRRRPRSGPYKAVDEVDKLVIEGGAVGLELERACVPRIGVAYVMICGF
jgi:hypothetical protein